MRLLKDFRHDSLLVYLSHHINDKYDGFYSINKMTPTQYFESNGLIVRQLNDVSVESCIANAKHDAILSKSEYNILIWPANIHPILDSNFAKFIQVLEYSKNICRINISDSCAIYIPKRIVRYNISHKKIIDCKYIGNYYDLDKVNDYLIISKKNIESRVFNKIIIENSWIKKVSTEKQKLYQEYKFIKNKNLNGDIYYPKVKDFEDNEYSSSYLIEYINFLDASQILLRGCLNGDIFYKFSLHILRYFDEEYSSSLQFSNDSNNFLIKKTVTRLSEARNNIKFIHMLTYLSDYLSIDLENFIDDFIIELTEKFFQGRFGNISEIHGDLCLSNILYDYSSDELRLIDPRGYSDVDSYYPIAYDLAKISHSLLGSYDHILHNDSEIIASNNSIYLKLPDINHQYIDLIKNISRKINVEYKYVRLLEASLFLSMIPLHSESNSKVLSFFLIFKNIFEEYKSGKYEL